MVEKLRLRFWAIHWLPWGDDLIGVASKEGDVSSGGYKVLKMTCGESGDVTFNWFLSGSWPWTMFFHKDHMT